jgi:hypothetical protein
MFNLINLDECCRCICHDNTSSTKACSRFSRTKILAFEHPVYVSLIFAYMHIDILVDNIHVKNDHI